MRRTLLALLSTCLLHGCASAPSGSDALSLFTPDGAPRFHAYLACVSDTVNCAIVERAFDRWADARHVALDTVMPENQAFSSVPSDAAEQKLPYRVALRYAPDLSAPDNPLGGGSMKPAMSYTATVHVFDAVTGRLLKSRSYKDRQIIDAASGPANPYIDASVLSFIGRVDRGYGKLASR